MSPLVCWGRDEGVSSARRSNRGLPWDFVGLVVRGNYVWCLVIFDVFMGFGGAKRWWDAFKSLGLEHFKWGLLYWNFIVSLTEYSKRFYRLPIFPIFLLFHLFCIYWDWQGQKFQLRCPTIHEINFELYCNCNFCLYQFLWNKHLYPQPHKDTFLATENP